MKRIIQFSVAAGVAATASIGLWAGAASAHHPLAVGHTTCNNDGTWTVHWTVGNSETAAGHVMTFDAATVNGAPISLSPASVAPSASAAGTSTQSVSTNSVVLAVTGRWAYKTPNVITSVSATVAKPTTCLAPTTTTTTVAPTTTTTVAATTTVAPTTTVVVAVTVAPTTTATPVVEDLTVVRQLETPEAATRAAPTVAAAHATPDATPGVLPTTGSTSGPLAAGGAGLLMVGAGLVAAARRRGAAI